MNTDHVILLQPTVQGGAVSKIILPQSVAVAAAFDGWVASESELLRFTVYYAGYNLWYYNVAGLLMKWLIRPYELLSKGNSHKCTWAFTGEVCSIFQFLLLL